MKNPCSCKNSALGQSDAGGILSSLAINGCLKRLPLHNGRVSTLNPWRYFSNFSFISLDLQTKGKQKLELPSCFIVL